MQKIRLTLPNKCSIPYLNHLRLLGNQADLALLIALPCFGLALYAVTLFASIINYKRMTVHIHGDQITGKVNTSLNKFYPLLGSRAN